MLRMKLLEIRHRVVDLFDLLFHSVSSLQLTMAGIAVYPLSYS